MAKEIRQETGIPLGAANAIAVKITNCETYELVDNPATERWCKVRWEECGDGCCSYTVITVTGPRGIWTRR